jgi:hypothetical protein
MRVNIKITHHLWKELDIEFLTPWDEESQARFLDLGLSWVRKTDSILEHVYDVVDKEKFLLSVIEYGIDFEEVSTQDLII